MGAQEKRNIVLCGFMGTGKSSVGKRLAELVQFEFLDLDAAIEAEAGMSISQIFSSRGESEFRILESRMVERIAGRTGCVIAAGGGTIVDPKNLQSLKSHGVLVTLTADVSAILRRIGPGDDRPMLREGDRTERIRTLLKQRAPVYAQADIMLDTSMFTIEEAAKQLIKLLRGAGLIL